MNMNAPNLFPMKTLTTLVLLVLFSPSVQAQLAPGSPAPLSAHLTEVNKEWQHWTDALPQDHETMVRFDNEADRIAAHLLAVRKHLLSHAPDGLVGSQLEQRNMLLDRLEHYANDRRFPQNHVLPYRNPIFIDPSGTACAVGWLMFESGHDALAEEISATMDQAYVQDMGSTVLGPAIGAWASKEGFAPEELAWIQPGYPPSTVWAPLGDGTNGNVRVLLAAQNGRVLVGGTFSEVGGIPAQQVALWNGSYLFPMGNGLQGEVNCAVEFNGNIYVGGSMLSDMNDLAMWNGNSWEFSTVTDGKLPWVNALHVHEGVLYAAGETMGFAGNDHRVLRFNGNTWEAVAMPLNSKIRTLESFNGDLVAAGEFTDLQFGQNGNIRHVARLVGNEWQQLGDGLNANVNHLLIHDGALYAGGDLFANMQPSFGLARIGMGQNNWEELLPQHGSYMTPGFEPLFIQALATHNGQLYVGGNFTTPSMMTLGNNIATFNGTPDGLEPIAQLDQAVHALAVSGNRLIMGGDFSAQFPHVAVTELATGIAPEMGPSLALELFPSPAKDHVSLRCSGADLSKALVRVVDLNGQEVRVMMERQGEQVLLDLKPIAAGSYVVQLHTGGRSYHERFVKE